MAFVLQLIWSCNRWKLVTWWVFFNLHLISTIMVFYEKKNHIFLPLLSQYQTFSTVRSSNWLKSLAAVQSPHLIMCTADVHFLRENYQSFVDKFRVIWFQSQNKLSLFHWDLKIQGKARIFTKQLLREIGFPIVIGWFVWWEV